MTQEDKRYLQDKLYHERDKELLLKDLCARLPYNVKIRRCVYTTPVDSIQSVELLDLGWLEELYAEEAEFKPYLFPLSSISEEQSIDLFKLFGISLVDSIGADYIKINECIGITFFLDKGFDIETHLDKLIDWLNKNHFDYRGLIEKGLAIDATGLHIY